MNVRDSLFYKEYLAEREEVMKHKWYESERAGRDIGLLRALIDWTCKYKSEWKKSRKHNEN